MRGLAIVCYYKAHSRRRDMFTRWIAPPPHHMVHGTSALPGGRPIINDGAAHVALLVR